MSGCNPIWKEYEVAPADWWYHSFPLPCGGAEVVSLDWVAGVAHAMIDRADATGDEAEFGPALHWAHLLKVEQGPEGDWPVEVNARTGEPMGAARTRDPARLLERLGAVLRSTEFDAAVALAKAGERLPVLQERRRPFGVTIKTRMALPP